MRLSVIVPVYNVEAYLAKCLDSLLCQGIASDEYEIIIVNDGATDGSAILAQKYVDLNEMSA
jgi:glycosyltransferase involved in cell wall biosynthesis